MTGNREYKSDVFSMLMEKKENALMLYNAVNGTDYTDTGMVEVCRLDRGISLTVRNDASFIVDANLSIYEHQSTVCPNMPVRSLIYFTTIIRDLIRGKNIYGRGRIRIPTPHFAVFYNGDEDQPEVSEQRLSAAYERPDSSPDLELKCRIYNINHGKNKALLEKCGFLKDYMTFVDYVREYYRPDSYENLEHAIELAIDRCIEEGILRDFLIKNRSEVVKVMQLDYTFDRQIALEREDARMEGHEEGRMEGRKEGRKEGREEGRMEGRMEGRAENLVVGIENAMKNLHLPLADVCDILGFTKTEYEEAKKIL